MTELRDPVQLIIIAMGSSLLPLLLWLVPPSRGPAEPVKPRRGASEWAGKDGEGPQRLRSPLELPACRRNQYETENLHSSEWGFLCFKCVAYGPADLQKTGPVWFSQLQPWLLGLDFSPDLHWLCVVLLKGISPQIIPNTQNVERLPRGMFFLLPFFFSIIRLAYPPQPSTSG